MRHSWLLGRPRIGDQGQPTLQEVLGQPGLHSKTLPQFPFLHKNSEVQTTAILKAGELERSLCPRRVWPLSGEGPGGLTVRMIMTRTAAGPPAEDTRLPNIFLTAPNLKGLCYSSWHSSSFPSAPQQLAECRPGPSDSPAWVLGCC